MSIDGHYKIRKPKVIEGCPLTYVEAQLSKNGQVRVV